MKCIQPFTTSIALLIIKTSIYLAKVNANANAAPPLTANSALALSSSKTFCTLCEGTTAVPKPNDIATNGITCQELAMTAVFYDEQDSYCTYFRQVAIDACSCPTSSPSAMASNAPSIVATVEPSVTMIPSVSPSYNYTPSMDPTSIFEKAADCSALENGNYPDLSNAATTATTATDDDDDDDEQIMVSLVLYYKAELFILEDDNLDTVMTDLQSKTSSIVSFDLAGCSSSSGSGSGSGNDDQDTTRHRGRRVQETRTRGATSASTVGLRKRILQTMNDVQAASIKVYYGMLTELEERQNESCGEKVVFVPSTCHVVQGKINIHYSTDNNKEVSITEITNFIKNEIVNIIQNRETVITSSVNGAHSFNIVSLEQGTNLDMALGTSTDTTDMKKSHIEAIPISLGVGLSVCVLLLVGGLCRKKEKRGKDVSYDDDNDEDYNDDDEILLVDTNQEHKLRRGFDSSQQIHHDDNNDEGYNIHFPLTQIPEYNCEREDYDNMDDFSCKTPIDEGIEIELLDRYASITGRKKYQNVSHEARLNMYEISSKCDDTVEL